MVVHQGVHLPHVRVGLVQLAQAQLPAQHLFGVGIVVLHPLVYYGADEGREVVVANHRHQRLEAPFLHQTQQVGWEGAVQHQGGRSLAQIQTAYGFLQGVEFAVAGQRPRVELVQPLGMLFEGKEQDLAIHARADHLLRRTEVCGRVVRHQILLDEFAR